MTRLAEQRYGTYVEYLANENKSFVICLSRPKVQPGNPLRPLDFFVFGLENRDVVFQDSLENAQIDWLDNTRFAVRMIPEIISDGEAADGYVFDVRTGKRHQLLENKNEPYR